MDKRRKNYFGCLANEGLLELTNEQRLNLFKKKKLYISSIVVAIPFNKTINLNDKSNFKTRLEPCPPLLDAYYAFILQRYQEHINNVFINFFHQFNNHTIGLKKKEAKIIARLLFMNIINNRNAPGFDFVHLLENPDGIPKLENTPKIELYYTKREAMKLNAIQNYPEGLNEYLTGNANYFNEKLIDKVTILKEIIQFEGELKIILTLNKQYKFEKYSTPLPSIDNQSETKSSKKTLKDPIFKNKIPTEQEMDDYLMKYVFSEKETE